LELTLPRSSGIGWEGRLERAISAKFSVRALLIHGLIVFLAAEHLLTKKRVAIKVLNKRKLAELNMSEKLWREIDIHKQLDHPHVIRIYDAINTTTDILVILEFAEGGDLFEFLMSSGKVIG
jgi:serine/threonine protein kinase